MNLSYHLFYLISVNEHVRPEKYMFSLEIKSFCKSDHESELPINKFYASRNLVKFNFLKGKVIFKIFVEL